MRNPLLLLKALIKKTITVPGYTKRDGTYIAPHQKQVTIDTDHAPKFDEHKLGPENSNAGTHNKKVGIIAQMHEAGDVGGLQGLKHGVNTYGKKQAKLAQHAIEHLTTPIAEPEPEPAAEPAPAPSAAEHVMDWQSYHLDPSNTNAPSHNKKVAAIQALHEAGDIAGLEAMTFGTNTYGKKQALLAAVAAAHLKEGGKASPQVAPAPVVPEPASAPAEKHFGEQHPGQIFEADGWQFKFDGAWKYRMLSISGKVINDWEPVKQSGTLAKLNEGKHLNDIPLMPLGADAPAPAPAASAPRFKFDYGGGSPVSVKKENGDWQYLQTDGQWKPILNNNWLNKLDAGEGLTPITGDAPAAPASPAVEDTGPKEGDTMAGADGMLVFHNGRWHKQRDGQNGAPKKTAVPDASANMSMFHHTEDGHNKFWAIGMAGATVTKHWGKIGTKGQAKEYPFATPADALNAYGEWVAEKQVKGYKLQNSKLPPPPAVAPTEPEAPEVDEPTDLEAELHAIAMPEGVPASALAVLEKFKQKVIDGELPGQLIGKKLTSPKWHLTKKLNLTFKGCSFYGNDAKASGMVMEGEDGQLVGASTSGEATVKLWNYVQAVKAAHESVIGKPVKKKSPKLILPANSASASSIAAAAKTKKLGDLTVAVIDGWKQTGEKQGTNPGGTFKDSAGQDWYVKFPATADHAKNELLASKLYKAAGVAVPQLRLIERDGKVGIASKIVDGVTKVGAGIKNAEGALDGFVVDAWLANHDAVGTGYDNLLQTKDGKAIRIDVGGALIYRAQGAPKGDLFGEEVGEIEAMRNPKINQYGAAVYGGISKEQLVNGAAAVLEIPDDVIRQLVGKFGPGDALQRRILADKLIARKTFLAAKFPEADAIANPPKPDPRALPVEVEKLPPLMDFMNWNGAGKGLSSNASVNKVNQTAVQEIYDAALQGNFSALKKLKYHVVNKQSGEITEGGAFADHPSQHVRNFYSNVIDYMEVIANPAAKTAKTWNTEEYSDVDELSEAFGAHFYGTSVGDVPANERLGFWISLGQAEAASAFAPANPHYISASDKTKGAASNKKIPGNLRQWMQAVKASGAHNQPYRDGKEVDNQGNKTRDVLAAAYEHAMEFEAGTKITKTISFPTEMLKQMLALEPGHVFQNPGSMCTSINSDWKFGSGHTLHIVTAPGAKGLYNIGVGSHDVEGEITTIPGQRFMLLETKQNGSFKEFTLLMLPPDETYVANIHPKG